MNVVGDQVKIERAFELRSELDRAAVEDQHLNRLRTPDPFQFNFGCSYNACVIWKWATKNVVRSDK